MPFSAGDRIGPYEIFERIGSGGMGEVWKARDTRLNRFVAIKTSHSRFSERFEREARATAALNHPHICSLYDVGPDYLVMEFIEGEALRGPVPVAQAVAVADQVLDALEASHRKGIIHRDLKPSNILVGRNGVKVLDFGLAKIQETAASSAGNEAATESMPLTAEGLMLGTLPYMSPEQVEGREADARSDIFAFGIVLYELIAGMRPFRGSSPGSLAASILQKKPQPLNELDPLVPASLAGVVQTCIEKDPENRWQSAREVRHALAWISAQARPAPKPAKSIRVWKGSAALLAVIALCTAGWAFWPKAPGQISRFEVPLPEHVMTGNDIAVSPDGRNLVFGAAGGGGLYIRGFDSLEWRRLPGTEGASNPFWSPDGRYIAFTAGHQIKKVDPAGGPPESLGTVPGTPDGPGTWNPSGVIILGSWAAAPGDHCGRFQTPAAQPRR